MTRKLRVEPEVTITPSPDFLSRTWTARVEIAGREADDGVYQAIGRQMAKMLEDAMAGCWKVSGRPEVVEEYDFLWNLTTLTATVKLVDAL